MTQELARQILSWYGMSTERSPEEIEKLDWPIMLVCAKHADRQYFVHEIINGIASGMNRFMTKWEALDYFNAIVEKHAWENVSYFSEGDAVKISPSGLAFHANTVPAHAGYTKEQFEYRAVIASMEGVEGRVVRVSSNSVDASFNGLLIQFSPEMLEKA
jgi:hypothetical protein